MDKKKIILIAIVLILATVAYRLITRESGQSENYVFNDIQNINGEEARKYIRKIDFENDSIKSLFDDDVVNPYTIRFFRSLQWKFRKSKTKDGELQSIMDYLYSVMDEGKADQMIALYKTYRKYQDDLPKRMKEWGVPGTLKGALQFLKNRYEYQKEIFGEEEAKALFGLAVKNQEYKTRRNVIVNDKELSGAAKEEKLKELNEDMWGDEEGTATVNMNPYTRYQDKMAIYQNDLSEMNDEERQGKVKEFREQYFTTDQIERLEKQVDQRIATEKEQETNYRSEEQKILNDADLSAEEKTEKLQEAQSSIFGKDADSFRRREKYAADRKKFLESKGR